MSIIQFVFSIINIFVFAAFFQVLLDNKYNLKVVFCVWLTGALAFSTLYNVLLTDLSFAYYAKLILAFAVNMLCVCALYKDSAVKKTVMCLMSVAVITAADFMAQWLLTNLIINELSVSLVGAGYELCLGIANVVMQLLVLLMIFPYLKELQKHNNILLSKEVWILPVSQCLLIGIWIYNIFVDNSTELAKWYLLCALIMLCVTILVTKLLYELKRKEKLMAEEIKQKGILEILTASQEDMDEISAHVKESETEFNAFLDELLQASKNGDIEKVSQNLKREFFSENKTAINSVTKNFGANYVLEQIKTNCRQGNIDLKLNLDIPRQLPVKDVHVCSLITNILNNAIKACAPINENERHITFSMLCVQSQFVISCQNSWSKKHPPSAGTGLGIEIIKDIVQKYGGIYQAEKTTSEYKLLIAIPLAVKGEQQ